jgi:hypothetical protein
MWTVLFLTLPAQPNAVRLRIWRALRALGCVSLRDGAYLLPSGQAATLEGIAAEVREHGGTADLLDLSPRSDAQRAEILAQFDRSDQYALWRESLRKLQATVAQLDETEARRQLRVAAEALADVRRIDYYPGPAAIQAEAELADTRGAVDAQFSRGEPQPTRGAIPKLDPRKFQGKRWATRARPWVDRLACAWLIARFIDREAEFVWVEDIARVPRGAIGFDYDGARFTHVGARVSFEVLMASFGLEADPKLHRIAAAVRFLDAGGIPVVEAAGLEAVLAGLRALHANDDRLNKAAGAVFDAMYASPAPAHGR